MSHYGRRRQVPRQPGAVTPQHLFITLAWLRGHCTALRVAMQGCHGTCSSARLRSGSSCVLRSTSFNRSSLPLHYTTFAAKHFASRHGPLAPHKRKHTNGHMPFASQQHGSLGSIPLRSFAISFQSCSVHPLPIIFARRLSPLRLRSLSAALITMPGTWLIRTSVRHAALSSLA